MSLGQGMPFVAIEGAPRETPKPREESNVNGFHTKKKYKLSI
jgi:hypothetical protein